MIKQQNISPHTSQKILFINTVMSVIIIFNHAINISKYTNLMQSTFGKFVYWFEYISLRVVIRLAVPVFFILAGYLFYHNLTYKNLYSKYKKRWRSLVIPFLFWNICSYFFFAIITNFEPIARYTNESKVALNLSNFFNAAICFKYSLVSWFMFQLIIFLPMAIFVIPIIKKTKTMMLFLLFLSILSIGNFDIIGVSNAAFTPVIRIDCLVYYMVGASVNNDTICSRVKKINKKSAIAIFICIYFITFIIEGKLPLFINPIRYVAGFAALWLMLDYIRIPSVPEYLQISFFMYCAHIYILETIEKMFYILFPHSAIVALIDYICAPIITLFILIAVAAFLKKHCCWLWGICNGGR